MNSCVIYVHRSSAIDQTVQPYCHIPPPSMILIILENQHSRFFPLAGFNFLRIQGFSMAPNGIGEMYLNQLGPPESLVGCSTY